MPENAYGQPVGEPLTGWSPRPSVTPLTLVGETCRLEPLAEQHLSGLYWALCEQSPPEVWTYLAMGPFESLGDFSAAMTELRQRPDLVPMVVIDAVGQPVGIACWMRIDPANGSAEVGNIVFGSALQRTTAATEAMYLMAKHVMDDLGYRRYEWKCDDLNAPSRRAALRLGFSYEGTFARAVVYKQRNRDTAWFAFTEEEWPSVRRGFERWLAPANFEDPARRVGQRASLMQLRQATH